MAATGKNNESDMFVLDMATTSAALGKVNDDFFCIYSSILALSNTVKTWAKNPPFRMSG